MPTKMKFETRDLTAENVAKIAELFPGVVAEGKVNFDLLRSMLGEEVTGHEAYEFTWVGKRDAIAEAGRPIRKTLRPCVEESKDWDTTENLYIEGDNLDVLKLLQESYLGKVKMIYIDPPYNTGNDFVYCDNFTRSRKEYEDEAGVYDEDGDRLFRNTETNGRFHSDWCSMMYPRLVLARNMLRDDGVIFISIDDNEVAQLREICDEIFNQGNLLCQAVWDLGTGTTAGHFTRAHEYILIYAKNKVYLPNFKAISDENIVHGALKKISKANPATDITFPIGFPFEGDDAVFTGVLGNSEQEFILSEKMEFKGGRMVAPTIIRAGWGMANQVRDWIAGRETFDSKGQKVVRFYFNKQGILFYEKERSTHNPKTVISGIANTKNGSSELKALFSFQPFSFPKPSELVKYLAVLVTDKDSIILDFFSGSATTAHAVMQLNAEDGGNRKFIMVQLPEPCAEGTEAKKAGYETICDIGKERIRRAGEKIRREIEEGAVQLKIGEEPKKVPDIGFRVLKLDDTNMNDVYYAASEYTQDKLPELENNIKPGRKDMDLLYGCLLDWGLPLSMPHVQEEIDGFTVHTYNGGDLVACFGERISETAIREIAGRKPLRAVFRDSGFASSPEKINVFEIFKLLTPNTAVKVI